MKIFGTILATTATVILLAAAGAQAAEQVAGTAKADFTAPAPESRAAIDGTPASASDCAFTAAITGVAAAENAGNPAVPATAKNATGTPATPAAAENPVQQQPRDEYAAELRKYFTISGTDASFPIMIESMIEAFEGLVTPEQFNAIRSIIQTTGYEKLLELFTPVYRKYISLGELREINEFYESPAGKKLAESLPKISVDAMDVSQEWAMYVMSLFEEKQP